MPEIHSPSWITLPVLVGLCLTAFCYWSIFAGGQTLTTPTFLQALGGIFAMPGTFVALFIPPTGIHSGVFDEVSFAANALFYSVLVPALFGYVGNRSKGASQGD